MREVQRQRHQGWGLTAGIAEHDPLVTRPLILGCCALYTTIDVCTLSVDGREYPAAIGVEAVGALVVAYLADDPTGDVL